MVIINYATATGPLYLGTGKLLTFFKRLTIRLYLFSSKEGNIKVTNG